MVIYTVWLNGQETTLTTTDKEKGKHKVDQLTAQGHESFLVDNNPPFPDDPGGPPGFIVYDPK